MKSIKPIEKATFDIEFYKKVNNSTKENIVNTQSNTPEILATEKIIFQYENIKGKAFFTEFSFNNKIGEQNVYLSKVSD
ncbi:MAG: hypothetical protein RJA07_1898 [Bacteroidota bacterium]